MDRDSGDENLEYTFVTDPNLLAVTCGGANGDKHKLKGVALDEELATIKARRGKCEICGRGYISMRT